MCWSNECCYPADLAAPGHAREFAVAQLESAQVLCSEEVLDDVRLVTSELVANAVDAGSDTVTVELAVHRHDLCIDVADHAPGWPIPEAPTTDRSHGRGLMIVAALSTDWGVRRDDTAKHVWALMSLHGDSTSLLHCAQE